MLLSNRQIHEDNQFNISETTQTTCVFYIHVSIQVHTEISQYSNITTLGHHNSYIEVLSVKFFQPFILETIYKMSHSQTPIGKNHPLPLEKKIYQTHHLPPPRPLLLPTTRQQATCHPAQCNYRELK